MVQIQQLRRGAVLLDADPNRPYDVLIAAQTLIHARGGTEN